MATFICCVPVFGLSGEETRDLEIETQQAAFRGVGISHWFFSIFLLSCSLLCCGLCPLPLVFLWRVRRAKKIQEVFWDACRICWPACSLLERGHGHWKSTLPYHARPCQKDKLYVSEAALKIFAAGRNKNSDNWSCPCHLTWTGQLACHCCIALVWKNGCGHLTTCQWGRLRPFEWVQLWKTWLPQGTDTPSICSMAACLHANKYWEDSFLKCTVCPTCGGAQGLLKQYFDVGALEISTARLGLPSLNSALIPWVAAAFLECAAGGLVASGERKKPSAAVCTCARECQRRHQQSGRIEATAPFRTGYGCPERFRTVQGCQCALENCSGQFLRGRARGFWVSCFGPPFTGPFWRSHGAPAKATSQRLQDCVCGLFGSCFDYVGINPTDFSNASYIRRWIIVHFKIGVGHPIEIFATSSFDSTFKTVSLIFIGPWCGVILALGIIKIL